MEPKNKFRGRDAITGNWAYGYYYPSKGHAIIRNENDAECIVLKETVGQFTGLLNKNGKEIYEGDIKREEFSIDDERGVDERIYYLCQWLPQTCSFVWMTFGDTCVDWDENPEEEYPISLQKDEQHKYIIVGNIHENPKLLI